MCHFGRGDGVDRKFRGLGRIVPIWDGSTWEGWVWERRIHHSGFQSEARASLRTADPDTRSGDGARFCFAETIPPREGSGNSGSGKYRIPPSGRPDFPLSFDSFRRESPAAIPRSGRGGENAKPGKEAAVDFGAGGRAFAGPAGKALSVSGIHFFTGWQINKTGGQFSVRVSVFHAQPDLRH